MSKRQRRKQAQKCCMYFCMNSYLSSFVDADFSGFKVPALTSRFIKTIPQFSVLSKKNIERQFLKGLRIFYRRSGKRQIVWEDELPLLKANGLTNALLETIIEMQKVRIAISNNLI